LSFEEFPKIARLSRNCVITEKIDGTNAQVHIVEAFDPTDYSVDESYVLARNDAGDVMLAGSRNRYITPSADNFGFAAWVKTNADALWALGPGRHYGEWWGSGIQRGYGLQKGEKRFSLFNTSRWADERDRGKYPQDRPVCCGVVPILYQGPFDTVAVADILESLAINGSAVSPGFMRPEGVVVYHEAARLYFKKTLDKDEEPKSKAVA
jgi:hypothetical protein